MMDTTVSTLKSNYQLRTILLDIFAVTCIYFVPAIAHLLSFPVYLAEPLRIMIVLAVVHTRKENAYFLALTLPLFSFLVSGHPIFYKMIIIQAELVLNIFLFVTLSKKWGESFFAMFLSVVISKLLYYFIQYTFILSEILTLEQVEHPIIPQIIMTIIFGIYVSIVTFLKARQKN